MKRIKKNSVGFFLVILMVAFFSIGWPLDYLFDFLYRQNNLGESGGKINYYMKNADNFDLVILGNSRARHNIITPSLTRNGYSLTHNGMPLDFHVALLEIMFDQKKVPDTVILHLDPFELSSENKEKINHLKYYYYQSHFIRSEINDLSWSERIKFYFPLYRFNGKIINILANTFFTIKNQSFDPGYMELPPDSAHFQIALKSFQSPTEEGELKVNQAYLDMLDQVIELAEQSSSVLIFYTAPLYFDLTTYQLRCVEVVYDHLQSQGVTYLDYLHVDKQVYLQDRQYWIDLWHLNGDGAGEFTAKLKKDMRSRLNRYGSQ